MRTPLPTPTMTKQVVCTSGCKKEILDVKHYSEAQMITYGQASYVRGLLDAPKAEVATAEAYRCGYEAGATAERETIAKMCEEYETENDVTATWLNIVAAGIRARGNK